MLALLACLVADMPTICAASPPPQRTTSVQPSVRRLRHVAGNVGAAVAIGGFVSWVGLSLAPPIVGAIRDHAQAVASTAPESAQPKVMVWDRGDVTFARIVGTKLFDGAPTLTDPSRELPRASVGS